jgi:hypothetical protein
LLQSTPTPLAKGTSCFEFNKVSEFANIHRRIFACGSVNPWKSIADYLKAQYPQYPVVDTAGVSEGSDVHIDTSILKSLGHSNFIPFQQTLKDTVDSLIALGVVENKQK